MTNPTEIEAVAEAIYLSCAPTGAMWSAVEEPHKRAWRARAKAAIAALDKARGWRVIPLSLQRRCSI